MRFRVIDEKGAYVALDPTPVRLDLGNGDLASRLAYAVTAPVYQMVDVGREISGSHLIYGPHLEPLDDEARAAAAAYWEEHPDASLDPTRNVPLHDGMGFEARQLAVLEQMAREASMRPQSSANDSKVDAMMAAIEKLASIVGSLAVGQQTGRNGGR